jgi:hypothetical protein
VILSVWLACSSEPAEVVVPTIEQERQDLVEGLEALVERSAAEGTYDCCTTTPCLHCVRMTGHCGCAEGLRRGEPVCEECAYHWQRGQGAIEGVDPKDVRSFLEAERAAKGEALCEPEAH